MKLEIKKMVKEFNQALAREKLVNDKEAIQKVCERYGKTKKIQLTTIFNRYGYRLLNGKYIKANGQKKEKMFQQKEKKKRLMKCNMCGKEFYSDLSTKDGFPLRHRCESCSNKLRRQGVGDPIGSIGRKVLTVNNW